MPHVHTNRLSKETSPYLLQHQHNPVDWYSWGPEAFEAARTQDKPIFLSVGYSTCYWCHVMERQSFENEAIAAEMNQLFICIKVDREERPDVDQLYMTAVQVLTRQGGWPMSVFLLPDLRPFYGGTYFPPTDNYGRPGFPTLLRALEDAYRHRRKDVEESAAQVEQILNQLAEPAAASAAISIDAKFVGDLVERSVADYEPRYGGFGSAPKFPRETLLELLLVYNEHTPDTRRQHMLRHTLDALANGGIRDHLGGGFHRYSTDAQWLVPHFEIMLYDNAMLAWVYSEAHRQFKEPRYARVARGIFDFVLREMTDPAGAFYTAFDAEVDSQEGLNYLWTAAEVSEILGKADGEIFNRLYGLEEGPNFADPHHGNGTPDKNILFLPGGAAMEDDPRIDAMRKKLLAARAERKQPLLDTKILTSWNALMIRAFAYGSDVLKEPRYLQAAEKAVDFLLGRHRTGDGTLLRTSRGDEPAKYNAFLDDYAFLAQALLAVHLASGDEKRREQASRLAGIMQSRFGDTKHGGFYFTDTTAGDLFIRQKTATDSPLPSGNAVAALTLLQLGEHGSARRTLAVFAGQLENNGEGMSALVQATAMYVRQHGAFTVEPEGDATERPMTPEQLATGAVQVASEWRDAMTLVLTLTIRPGFHINAHQAASGLIATDLSIEGATVDYPPGEEMRFAFSDEPIRVYSGTVEIAVRFAMAVSKGVRATLRYQPCDENACLSAVSRMIEIAAK